MTKKKILLIKKAESRPARVTPEAHEATTKLCELYAKELGLSYSITRTDAISRAVLEAVTRRTESVAA